MPGRKPDSRRGQYLPVLPLDVLILKTLPREGSMFMDVYPEAASIKDIQKAIAGGQLSSNTISTRLRVMHLFGLCVAVTVPRSHTAGWQVTAKGEAFAADEKEGPVVGGGDGS